MSSLTPGSDRHSDVAAWTLRQRIIRISPWTEQDGTVSRRYLVLLGKWVIRVQ